MNRQQLSTLLFALGVLVLFSNWGRLSDLTEATLRQEQLRPHKVVYWSNSGSPEQELKAAAEFMQRNPDVLVKPNFRESGGLQDILYVSFLSGNPPDYMNAQEHELRKYALIGGLRPFDDLLEQEGPDYFERYTEGKARVHRFQVSPDDPMFARNEDGSFKHPLEAARLLNLSGKAVGLRGVSLPDTITYNKRLFREAARMFPEAGLVDEHGEPTPPQTWLQFYKTAQVISEYGRRVAEQRGSPTPYCYGVVLQGQRSTDLRRSLRPLARRAGTMSFQFQGSTEEVQQHIDTSSEAGQRAATRYQDQPVGFYQYEHPSNLAAFALLFRMREEGLVLPGMESRHYEDVRTALAAGQAAMVIDGWHAALIGTERVPWAAMDLGSAPIPVPYGTAVEEKEELEELLGLNELGISLPPGNPLPRAANDSMVFLTSACRSPEATWAWLHDSSTNEDALKRSARRGTVPTEKRARVHLGDPEWFPYPYQAQVYDIMDHHCSMWPTLPQQGPVEVPTDIDVFYKYFYSDSDLSLAERLPRIRSELENYSQASNQELARRMVNGLTRPESWSFPDFNVQDTASFFARQQSLAQDPDIEQRLQQLRSELISQAAAQPQLQSKLLNQEATDLRSDLWRFTPTDSPWMSLWIPGLMLGSLLLWLVLQSIKHRKNHQEWWQSTRLQARQNWQGYVFILPGMILLFAFTIYPSLYQIALSLQRGDGLGTMQWVGWDNFARILNPNHPRFDRVFWFTVVPNTISYMLVVTVGQVGFGLLIASLLNLPLKSNSVYRVLFFIPLVTSLAIVSVILIGLLKGEDSGLNQFLLAMGWQDLPYHLGLTDEQGQLINWLGEKAGLETLMAVGIWHGLPYNIILLLAGLQSISPQLYEAARVDGANAMQRFWHVTVPELLPILIIIAFQAFIGASKAFSLVFVLTEGGINHSSELVATYIWKWGFMKPEGRDADLGYASALGIIYSLLLISLTAVNVYLVARRWRQKLDSSPRSGKKVTA